MEATANDRRRGKAMSEMETAGSVDEHIAAAPPQARPMLEELRAIIRAAAPEATESISYGIPTFDLGGRHLVHFAGYAKHVGFYPTGSGVAEFREQLGSFATGKGTVQFPLDQRLPADLVRRVVEYRVREVEAAAGYANPGK
jgi:uncharacterized protein YdhG (YjbR/CyaY superfamily)